MSTDPIADHQEIRAQALRLLEPPVIYVPIRHHSPTCALHVRSLIEHHQPYAVLIEGPPSFDDQIELLLDPSARMPLAIYSHVSIASRYEPDPEPAPEAAEQHTAEPERFGAYFPFCDYSPELVALRAGHKSGARLGFVDLDYQHSARFASSSAGHTDEQRYRFSQTLGEAARQIGCRDHNELWDQMVEGRDDTPEAAITAVLTYGTLARMDAESADLASDGTLAREAAMAEGIVEVLRDRESEADTRPVIVVAGAFHTVVLPGLVESLLNGESAEDSDFSTPDPNQDRKQPGLEILDNGHGLLRYSFDRLDALAGYAAGMPSPNWYQWVWEARTSSADSTQDYAHVLIAEVANALREVAGDGQPSLPSVVDALVAAEQLRRLRGRAFVTRNDAIDALVSCFTKGEDSPTNRVRSVARLKMTGFDLGSVPPQTPRVPLAEDFDRLVLKFAMPGDTAEPKQLNLDVYRSERDRFRSRFLHGLAAIGVHYGRCTTPLRFSRTSGRDVIRERWLVQLDGGTDVSLAEASLWGSSIAEAVGAKTRKDLEELLEQQPSAAQVMNLIMKAAQRGVPAVVRAGIADLRQRVAVDPSLPDVVRALSEAELLWTAREPLGGTDLTALPELASQLFVRACQLGGRVHEAPEQEWRGLVASLDTLHRIVTTAAWPQLDDQLFWSVLSNQRGQVAPGMLRGAIGGLEWRGGRIEDGHLLTMTRGHLDPAADAKVGAEFLSGLILVARDAIWEVDGLIEELSAAFGSYSSEQFLRRVPGLRSAFASLTPRQTDRVAEAVMETTGGRVNVSVVGITEAEVLKHSLKSAEALRQLADDGFGAWLELVVDET